MREGNCVCVLPQEPWVWPLSVFADDFDRTVQMGVAQSACGEIKDDAWHLSLATNDECRDNLL